MRKILLFIYLLVFSSSLVFGFGFSSSKTTKTEIVEARNVNGLKLTDDGGNGISIIDGGDVGIGTTLPAAKLSVEKISRSHTSINTDLPILSFPAATSVSAVTVEGASNSSTNNVFGSQIHDIVNTGLNYASIGMSISSVTAAGDALGLVISDVSNSATVGTRDAYGVIIDSVTVSSDTQTAYGLHINNIDNPFDATKEYSIYADGDARSYFNGAVGIGITNPSEKLEVAGNIIGETFGNNAFENVKFNNNQFMYTLDGSIYRPFQPIDEITIYSEADFPVQDATTITLQDLYEYVISSTIYVTKKFIFEDDARVRISGSGVFKGVLAYLGTDALFNANTDLTGEDLDTLNLFNVVCSAPTGTIFDIKNSINQNPTSIILIQTSSFVTVENLGKIENYNNFADYVSFWLDCGYGLHLKDTKSISLSDIKMYAWKNYTTDFLKIDGELTDILYSSIVVFPQSNEYSMHITSSSFFTSVIGAGGIINSVLNGGTKDNFFNPDGFGKDNVEWTVTNVTKVEDSTAFFQIGYQDNTSVEITIDSANVPIKVNSGLFIEEFKERFITYSTGTVVYEGLEDVTLDVTAVTTMRPTTGTGIELGTYIAVTDIIKSTVTFTNATNKVNRVAHGLINGTSIRFRDGTLPAELRHDQFHWVINTTTDDFEVSASSGGVVEAFTDDGTGTINYSLGGVIHSSESEDEASSGTVANFISSSLIAIETGDEIEVFCDNHDTTSNIVVKAAQFKGTK